ncbi:hypothetical protein P171DRAFT_421748 [Karstenula rhodostoma CBS 690.94]|uniref:RTA1-domain-containing protein n=1 Tax=Karstenula rhodostoma CBS 690.94 TaxID=1392251 RepID=A0A9P4U707_9PLEO|nr:hypothetical protein P171DRAFT_421748 [Karstenula rhodostoma CBS 690.94]
MISFARLPLVSSRSAPDDPSPSHDCPTTTVKPDANGWVPPGTCGYISRPYYPSFVAALVFCAAAVLVLLGFSGHSLSLPWIGALVATCLLAAYILRAFGTIYQQVPEFVAFSDTLVLVCPILIFALDCTVLQRLITAYRQDEKLLGVTGGVLSRVLLVTIPFLAIEQLVASVLIAPKHRSSPSGSGSSTAIIGLKFYLVGIGVQEVLVVYVSIIAILLHKKLRDNEVVDLRAKATYVSSQLSNKCRSTIYSLIFSLAAIFTRVAYRLIELSGIFTGHLLVLMHNEIFFYTLECLPVLAALGVWTIVGFEDLLKQTSLNSIPVGTYAYHEIGGELVEDHGVPLD